MVSASIQEFSRKRKYSSISTWCNRPKSGPCYFEVSEHLQLKLTSLAQHAGRPEDQLAQERLAAGLTEYYSQDEWWKRWETLTPREREVTPLICLRYTNRQAAARMSVTKATVKFHVSNALEKFGVDTRSQLQQLLQEWDFSALLTPHQEQKASRSSAKTSGLQEKGRLEFIDECNNAHPHLLS